MKFKEYLASFITPQMTLLEKFNAMCKFMETYKDGTKLYFHKIVFEQKNSSGTSIQQHSLCFINTKEKQYSIDDINLPSFYLEMLSGYIDNFMTILEVAYTGVSVFYYFSVPEFTSIRFTSSDWEIKSQEVVAL